MLSRFTVTPSGRFDELTISVSVQVDPTITAMAMSSREPPKFIVWLALLVVRLVSIEQRAVASISKVWDSVLEGAKGSVASS